MTSNEPDYLHPDGKPDDAPEVEELGDNEKFSGATKANEAEHEADGHSIERKDTFLGNEGDAREKKKT